MHVLLLVFALTPTHRIVPVGLLYFRVCVISRNWRRFVAFQHYPRVSNSPHLIVLSEEERSIPANILDVLCFYTVLYNDRKESFELPNYCNV